MNLLLTEEQREIRDAVRRFAEEVIRPRAPQIDEEDRFPRDIIQKMADLGFLGIPIPEEWGGVGADFVSYVLAIEEVAKVSAAVAVILAVHTSLGALSVLYHGSKDQKDKYLRGLASGRLLGAFALTEPQAGSDAASLQTRARREPGGYRIDGRKVFITNGGEADLYLVFANLNPEAGRRGITAFLVEADNQGLIIGKKERKMGLNGSATTELIFEDCRVPDSARLGGEGEGYRVAMSLLDGGRIGIAAQALGIAEGALELARAYVKERQQFGRRIGDFQGVQFILADRAAEIEAARLMVYRAATMRAKGLPCAKEAAMAKLYASDTAMRVTVDAVQLHGGYGYIKDYAVERYMRDAKVTQIYEGTNQIQRMVVAKHVLGSA
ncbi:acyl-CoA dehydrogenase [Kyrpidia spormannii]|uniref:Acyl-CoA dehydrogenase n=2 Tax=Kyrpidia spormannii TaxID=2055160 RepID=A0A6F9EHD3_9BACL|nr:acyl-CoA dehydrogenase [Kyrpidia spormannii]CAB3395772.1 propionyl-CoA dehydrogenase subunit [Kyrpidia spormannii]CAB3396313.1 propionyl-CoA dehydrogenase subunit [Kyrpidia spormannii]